MNRDAGRSHARVQSAEEGGVPWCEKRVDRRGCAEGVASHHGPISNRHGNKQLMRSVRA